MVASIGKNFYLVTLPEISGGQLLEYSNVLKLCHLLEDGLSSKALNDVIFVFVDTLTYPALGEELIKEVDVNGYKRKVLIWFGEESGTVPSDAILERFDISFKSYMKEDYPEKNLFSLPLILPGDVPICEIIPFNKRKFNVFFSGNLNINRVSMFVEINKRSSWLEKLLLPFYGLKKGKRLFDYVYGGKEFDLSNQIEKSIIRFNNGFNKGYPKHKYASITSDSKIVLSPRGYVSSECFRTYESMRQGCVVICEQLPQTHIYQGIPVIQVEKWKRIRNVIKQLLEDNQKLNELSLASTKFYHENLSLEAIAKNIINKIQTLES